MRLTKLLRRYSRVLLMVFMSLLLVVFLIGSQLQEWARKRANPEIKIGHCIDGDIFLADTARAQNKKQLLLRLGFADVAGIDPLDLHLLLAEARRMGVRIGAEQVKDMLRRAFDPEVVKQRLALLQRQTNMSYASMYELIGEWLAVQELILTQADAIGNSLPRAEHAFRDSKEEAVIKLSVIDSRALVSKVPEPSEEELAALFEEGKNRFDELTEDEIRFGYKLPDRVKVEYLTVDPRRIESKVRIRERDVKRFFEEHARRYMKTITPATQSTQPQAPTRVPMTYEEARERVRRDYRKAKAILEAQSLVNDIHHTAYQPWQAQPKDEHGFREPPPADALVSFADLRDRFSERYEVEFDTTDLLDQEALQAWFDPRPTFLRERFGRRGSPEPYYVEGQTLTPLSELAMRVKGIFVPDPDDRLPVLNVLEPSPVLQTFDTNPGTGEEGPYQAYIFRDVEVAPAGPPASLDEVRDELVEDFKLLKAHQQAGEYAQQLAAQARTEGLEAAVAAATELKQLLAEAEESWQPPPTRRPNEPPPTKPHYVRDFGPNQPTRPVTRSSTSLEWVGQNTQKVQREVFALADTLASDTRPAHIVAVVEVANLFKWVVVELERIKPLYADEFEQVRSILMGPVDRQTFLALKASWLSSENVRRRNGYVPLQPGQDRTQ